MSGRSPTRALGRLLALALIALGMAPLVATASRAEAPGAGTVRLRPAALTLGVGQTATVEVWLEDGVGYHGLELRLAWEEGPVGAAAGQVRPLWEVFDGGSHLVVRNRTGWCDDRSGQVWHGAWYAVANVSPAVAFTGSGRVCTLSLTGLAPGATELRVLKAEGGTDTGGTLRPAAMGGAIVVVAPTPTPTATPTLTRTDTPLPRATIAAPVLPAPAPWVPPAGQSPAPTATATSTPTATPPPAEPRPSPAPAPAPPPAGPSLSSLLWSFLLGAVLTAAALRLRRRPAR